MSSFVYIITEGVLDVVFISQVLCCGFGGEIIQRKNRLPERARQWLNQFRWPVGDDIARRAVPAPSFIQFENGLAAVRNAQGLANIRKTLTADQEAFLRLRWQPTSMGIVLDADVEKPAVRFGDFAALLHDNGYPKPVHLDCIEALNDRRAGVFAFPGQGRSGTLEDVLMSVAACRFPTLSSRANKYIQDFFDSSAEIEDNDLVELKRPSGPKKAKLSALAAVLKPGKPLSASIEDQHWLPAGLDAFEPTKPLMNFLVDLMAFETTPTSRRKENE